MACVPELWEALLFKVVFYQWTPPFAGGVHFIMGFCLRHRAAGLAKPEPRRFPGRAILGLYGQCV